MSGILRLESLTKGNTLKQGDKTPLKYKLFDADGEKLNIAGKSAQVRLVYPDFLTIGYEKDGLTVSQDDTVTFTIDGVIPARIYHVEIIVDDKFIFPSRADETKFTVDKSSLGAESNIIEIVGVDQIVNKVLGQVDADISQAVTDVNATNDAIQQAELERKQWFEDTQIILENLATYENLSYAYGTEAYVKDNEIIVTNLHTSQEQISVGLDSSEINIYYASGELQSNSNEDSVRTIGLDSNVVQNHSGDGKYMKYSFVITSNPENNNRFRYLNTHRTGSIPDGTVKIRNTMLINLTQVFGAGREPSVELMDYLMDGFGYFSTHTLTLGDILRLVTNPSEDIDTSSLVNEVLGHINPTINDLTTRMDNLETEGGSITIEDGSITPEKTSFISVGGNNLFDKNKRLEGQYWMRSNGVAVLGQAKDLNTHPNPIPVKPGETYYKNRMGHILFADKDNNVIFSTNSMEPEGAFVVPENGAYMYFNVFNTYLEEYQIEKGDRETDYSDGVIMLSPTVSISESSLPPKISKVLNTSNYYTVNSAGDFTVYLLVSDNEFASYRFSRATLENYMKMNESGIYRKEGSDLVHQFHITEDSSNKEFAVDVSPVEGDAREWFPQHNNVGTVNPTSDGIQQFIADGKVVDLETPTGGYESFDNGEFSQVVYGKLPDDEGNRAKIIIKYDFDKTVKQYFEIEFLKETKINKLYSFMIPVRQDYVEKIKTNRREVVYSKESDEVLSTPFSDLVANEFIATSSDVNKKDYFIKVTITNQSHDLKTLVLQHRSSRFQKLYPLFIDGETVPAGTKMWFDGEYEIGKLLNANVVYG